MREIQNGVVLDGSTELKVAQVEIWCGTGVFDDKVVLERSQVHHDAFRIIPKVM